MARTGIAGTVLDLRWLVPLPEEHLLEVATDFDRVLVVDETRRSGGVSEGVVTALVDGGYAGRISRVTAEDSSCRSGRPRPTSCSRRTTSWPPCVFGGRP